VGVFNELQEPDWQKVAVEKKLKELQYRGRAFIHDNEGVSRLNDTANGAFVPNPCFSLAVCRRCNYGWSFMNSFCFAC